MLKKTKTSIQWRIMSIFFVIVFIAMTVAGVFITERLESYEINSIRTNCTKISKSIEDSIPFEQYDSLNENQESIQAMVSEWQTGTNYEVYIVDSNFNIIASGNTSVINKSAIENLDDAIIVSALEGAEAESQTILSSGINVLNMANPVMDSNNEVLCVLVLRADLTSVYDTTNEAKIIFIQAMVIALLITILLTYLITGSITEPINDLTQKAEKMASGDFSQVIEGKSNDEIGRLAEMFNILRQELFNNIDEITNEKSKLETILKYMADGLIATDLYGEIIHVNDAAKDLLDLTDTDMETLNFDKIMQRLGKRDIADGIGNVTSREVISEMLTYESKILFIRYARFMDDEDNDIGVIMLIQDITERQKLEQMQADFVANVSHELRTPLTTIKSYTETLVDGRVTDEATREQFLSVIDEEAERMTHLVKELLQLSRLDNNCEKLNLQETDINLLMTNCAQKIMFTAQAKQQTVICEFDINQSLNVMIDRDKIQQVILNVLTNAIKYTLEGGTIRMDSKIENNFVKIMVSDTGIGINKSELERIFERFYRVDKARSRAMGGTGLGLSIAKQIVEAHHGEISAESTEGVGTTVTIALPLTWSRGKKNIE